MAARAREVDALGTGSVREVFLLVALGLFMLAYGAQGVGAAEGERAFLLLTSCSAMAAGVAFLLAAFFGARRALRQRRR